MAEEGFEALMKGTDHVVAGATKNAVQAAAGNVLPDPVLAARRRRMSEPGTVGN